MSKFNSTTSFDFLEYGNASHAFVKKEIHKDIFYGYKVASDMWDLAGDKSTDLNYYSKRLILVSIYSNILFKILSCKTYKQESIKEDIDKSLDGVKKFNEVKSSILKQFS